ncbi:MAG: type transporter [Caulobacter sp.]|nr:type transporter [Caulobacter sp.]
MPGSLSAAVKDIGDGARLAPLWWRLGMDQTKARFQRSILGPFWMAANLLVVSFALHFIVGGLLGGAGSNYPQLIGGLLAWGLVGISVGEAANLFLMNGGLMQTQRLPLTFYVFVHTQKAMTNFLAQLIAFWTVMLLMKNFSIPDWSFLPGLLIVTINVYLLSFILAIPSTRFRDVGYMSGFIVQMAFFLTPVFWTREQMRPARRFIVDYNPLAHMVELVRAPLLGQTPPLLDWLWGLGMIAVLGVIALILLAKFGKRVVFWL